MLIPNTNSLTNPACFSDTVIQKKKQEDGECLFLGKNIFSGVLHFCGLEI